MKKVVVILGPTGVGKTALSIAVAKKFQCEIISGDSIQVFKGLDIGSAKIKPDEMQGVKHHLIDILNPGEPFSVAEFQRIVREKIASIDCPLIVGGTGLYIDAVIKKYDFNENRDPNFANEYRHFSNEELYAMLLQQDPKCSYLHFNNRQRVLRALEVVQKTGVSITERNGKHEYVYDAFVICLNLERDVLYERINSRVDKMVADGLLDEAFSFYQRGIKLDGIGYKELFPYFEKKISLADAIDSIKKNSRHFAKRQMTWFNNQDDFIKIPVNLEDFDKTINEAIRLIKDFLSR